MQRRAGAGPEVVDSSRDVRGQKRSLRGCLDKPVP